MLLGAYHRTIDKVLLPIKFTPRISVAL